MFTAVLGGDHHQVAGLVDTGNGKSMTGFDDKVFWQLTQLLLGVLPLHGIEFSLRGE